MGHVLGILFASLAMFNLCKSAIREMRGENGFWNFLAAITFAGAADVCFVVLRLK